MAKTKTMAKKSQGISTEHAQVASKSPRNRTVVPSPKLTKKISKKLSKRSPKKQAAPVALPLPNSFESPHEANIPLDATLLGQVKAYFEPHERCDMFKCPCQKGKPMPVILLSIIGYTEPKEGEVPESFFQFRYRLTKPLGFNPMDKHMCWSTLKGLLETTLAASGSEEEVLKVRDAVQPVCERFLNAMAQPENAHLTREFTIASPTVVYMVNPEAPASPKERPTVGHKNLEYMRSLGMDIDEEEDSDSEDEEESSSSSESEDEVVDENEDAFVGAADVAQVKPPAPIAGDWERTGVPDDDEESDDDEPEETPQERSLRERRERIQSSSAKMQVPQPKAPETIAPPVADTSRANTEEEREPVAPSVPVHVNEATVAAEEPSETVPVPKVVVPEGVTVQEPVTSLEQGMVEPVQQEITNLLEERVAEPVQQEAVPANVAETAVQEPAVHSVPPKKKKRRTQAQMLIDAQKEAEEDELRRKRRKDQQ